MQKTWVRRRTADQRAGVSLSAHGTLRHQRMGDDAELDEDVGVVAVDELHELGHVDLAAVVRVERAPEHREAKYPSRNQNNHEYKQSSAVGNPAPLQRSLPVQHAY